MPTHRPIVDIIIPTWNNQEYLQPCLTSLIMYQGAQTQLRILVVNNGDPDTCDWIPAHPRLRVIQAAENLGWTGGLKLGLRHAQSEFVCFLNDDTYVPPSSRHWLDRLLEHFSDPRVGAVGPSSNIVSGRQKIFVPVAPHVLEVPYLIGFCLLLRRSTLDEVGGIDDTLPGADDLDLSIRLRQAGYKLLADREVFIFHHGYISGVRRHGDRYTPHGWNSYEMWEANYHALIRKHGLRAWWDCLRDNVVERLGYDHRQTLDDLDNAINAWETTDADT